MTKPSLNPDVEIDKNNSESEQKNFDVNLIRNYPKAGKRLHLNVEQFGLEAAVKTEFSEKNAHSVNISPYGIEFRTSESMTEGDLIKVRVALPDYWDRKRKFVSYGRIDSPADFKILARVVKTTEVGKRGKKQLVSAQTLVMDDVDEQVLKHFLSEG